MINQKKWSIANDYKHDRVNAMIELKHLRYFVALAEEEHFGRAAERVFVVQQALSSSIQKLEKEVGVSLVTRSTRRVSLTPAGIEFLSAAREILALSDQAVIRAQQAARGEIGHLTLGFMSGLVFGHLPQIVQRFCERYPMVRLELRELTPQEQEAALRAGTIDLGLLLLPVRDSLLSSQVLWKEPLIAALPAGHPLSDQNKLHIADLRESDFVFFPRHLRPTYYEQVMSWCQKAGYTPRIVQEAIEIPTLLSLVAAGVGVFLPMHFFSRVAFEGVVYRPVHHAPQIEIAAAWVEERRTMSQQAFLEVVQEVTKEEKYINRLF